MRKYSYITIGYILQKLKEEGCEIDRQTFKKLMKKELLFQMTKTAAGWYVCNKEEMKLIIQLIKENYAK